MFNIGSTRTITRPAWKALWRQSRIIDRETSKAMVDLGAFGTSMVQIGPDVPDLIRRVDPAHFTLASK